MNRLIAHRRISVMLGLMEKYSPTQEHDPSGDRDVAALLTMMPRMIVTVATDGEQERYTAKMLNLDGEVLSYSESY